MTPLIKYDALKYRAAVNRLITEKRADARMMLAEESRLLLRDIITLTPPKTQGQGERSVEANLRRAFSPLDPKKFENGTATGGRIAKLIRKRNYAGLNALFSRMKGSPLAGVTIVQPKDMQSVHRRQQDARGRIRRNRGMVSLLSDFTRYALSVRRRVGWAKAGWLAAAQLLGLALPGYVRRHGTARGSVAVSPAPLLAVTMTNYSSKIPDYQAKVDFALRVRYRSFMREAARILAGGKSRRASFAGTPTGAKRE